MDLVWLRFAIYILEINQLGYTGVGEDVVTAAHSHQVKSKSLDECHHIEKPDVPGTGESSL